MAGDGYKIAEAYADFHFDTDKAIDEAVGRLRASGSKFDRAGKDAGDGYAKGFRGGLNLGTALDGEIAKVRAKGNQISRTGSQAGEGYARGFKTGANLRPAIVEQIAVLKTAKPAFTNEGKQAGQAYAKGFGDSKLTTGSVSVGSLGKAGEGAGTELGKGVERGYQKSVQEVDKDTEKVAARTQASFKALVFAGAFAGLPVAAAVGAAGVGAALAAVPALFIGIGAAAISSNDQVQASYSALKTHVQTDTTQMAGVLAGPVMAAAKNLGSSFDRLKPQIQAAMRDSVPAVAELTGAVTDFAENAMPGMVVAIRASDAPLKGLRVLAGDTGAGVTDMFTNMAAGSDSAGESLGTVGGIIRDLLGFTGSLFANLSNGSTAVLPQFRAALGQVEGVALSLTSNGMPALQGATSGVLGVVGGGLGIVSAFAQGLGSWAQPLASAGGSLYATNTIAKLFGTSLGSTGFGLKAFATSVDEAGNKTSPFKAAVAGAEGATNKFKAGVGAVVSNGINPLGLALLAGGFLLDAYGRKQQEAAEKVAQHREGVRTLTDAIRQDNGVLGENTAKANLNALEAKNAVSNLRVFGETMGDAKLAIEGNSQAYDRLKFASGAAIADIAKQSGLNETQTQNLIKMGQSALDTGQDYGELSKQVQSAGATTNSAGTALTNLTSAQKDHLAAIINGNGAVGEQIRQQREAYAAYLLSESGLSGLTTEQVRNRDATNEATQALYTQQNAQLGYRGAVLNVQAAQEAYNKTLKDGKATDEDKAKSLLQLEQAYAAEEQAAYNSAYASSQAKTESGKLAEANAAADRETVKLANTLGNNLPLSMQQTIAHMNVTQAAAAGLTVGIDGTGAAVYRLPNGKTIKVAADTDQARANIAEILRLQDSIQNKVVSYTVNVRQVGSAVGFAQSTSQTGRAAFNATGNILKPGGVAAFAGGGFSGLTPMTGGKAEKVKPNTWRVIGDNMNVPESYIPLDPGSKRSQDLLTETNKIMGRNALGFSGGGLIGAAREILGQLDSGGSVFEDFSFRGNSANVKANNDALLELFSAAVDGNSGNAADQRAWLTKFVGSPAIANSTMQPAGPGAGYSAPVPFSDSSGKPGKTVVNHNYFTLPPTDVSALATLVSYELDRRGR